MAPYSRIQQLERENAGLRAEVRAVRLALRVARDHIDATGINASDKMSAKDWNLICEAADPNL